ncbi:hypothetical protein A4U61_08735 [Streptomyces sp. H-KF8]|nr:hypothetical protein A4U61_08735 [Streptomyces sp. H-KF8]
MTAMSFGPGAGTVGATGVAGAFGTGGAAVVPVTAGGTGGRARSGPPARPDTPPCSATRAARARQSAASRTSVGLRRTPWVSSRSAATAVASMESSPAEDNEVVGVTSGSCRTFRTTVSTEASTSARERTGHDRSRSRRRSRSRPGCVLPGRSRRPRAHR